MTKIFNKSELKNRRRELRNQMPKAEALLWSALRSKQIKRYKFRRQYSISRFVVDFYCPKLKLAIEVDGDSHCSEEEMESDKVRQQSIESLGIRFIRFTNADIYDNLDEVVSMIEKNMF